MESALKTFANPTLKNEMVRENGKVKPGSLARIEPEQRGGFVCG